MNWRDEGLLLLVKDHGEASVIIEVLTSEHGRHAGLVRGGTSRKLRPVLQPGNQIALEWSARLETHLGSFKVEPLGARAAVALGDRLALEGVNTLTAMLSQLLPEREPMATLYSQTIALADEIGEPDWAAKYALWECALLGHLGFGLDLNACAVTGAADNLTFVSPKSGRAVTAEAAGQWADKLLPLPRFLNRAEQPKENDVADALRLTGHFLRHHVAPSLGRDDLPAARDRFLALVLKARL